MLRVDLDLRQIKYRGILALRGRRKSPLLTDVELTLMHVIWRSGPSTVLQVSNQLTGAQKRATTTIATFLGILVTKGFLRSERSGRSLIFSEKVSEFQYQKLAISHVKKTLFDNSVQKMMRAILAAPDMTKDELVEIQQIFEVRLKERK